MTETQNAQILAHLKAGHSITPIEALTEYGCFRLGARIYDLRGDGHAIERELDTCLATGKRFARYFLATPAPAA